MHSLFSLFGVVVIRESQSVCRCELQLRRQEMGCIIQLSQPDHLISFRPEVQLKLHVKIDCVSTVQPSESWCQFSGVFSMGSPFVRKSVDSDTISYGSCISGSTKFNCLVVPSICPEYIIEQPHAIHSQL